MGLCKEHRRNEYHDDEDCIVCEKDKAIKCCQARKEQLIDKVKQFEDEVEIFRYLLWLRHGHDGLYGDDGEMQCGQCLIDFKRDSAQKIDERFVKIAQKALESKDG